MSVACGDDEINQTYLELDDDMLEFECPEMEEEGPPIFEYDLQLCIPSDYC
jgi:hypothetical protein